MKLSTRALIALISAYAFTASAQSAPEPKPDEKETPTPNPTEDTVEVRRATKEGEERPVAYLGVFTGGVSRELRAQFQLQEGFGLQVVEVMPDSPARQAGLQEHDVILRFEDQKLVNMEQLQTLVRSKKKGDRVQLTVLTSGQEKMLTVEIGERMARAEEERRPMFPMGPFFGGGKFSGDSDEWREQLKMHQHELSDYQQRVQEWARNGQRGAMPPPPRFEGPRPDGWRQPEGGFRDEKREGGPRDEAHHPRDADRKEMRPHPERGGPGASRFSSESKIRVEGSRQSANITRSDDTGLYNLRRDDGRSTYSVTPKEGQPQSWPVNTEEERAAVPERFREKLREMMELSEQMNSRSPKEKEERGPEAPKSGI